MEQGLLDRVRECHALPSLPTVAMQVLEVAGSDETGVVQLADVIGQDPALSAKLLRTVNSSFYGYAHSISSLRAAVVALGMQSVKTLVLGFSLLSGLSKGKTCGFDHLTYWRRSLYAATAAEVIARRVRPSQQQNCFLAALLMDIGMLAMDRVLGLSYGEICRRTTTHEQLAAEERKALGASHQEVSAYLAERWQLPALLAEPMGHHHEPEHVQDATLRPVVELVALAGRCGDIFVDAAPMWSIADVRRMFMERYGIKEIECDAILCEISLRTRDLAPLFELSLDGDATYETILQRANDQLLQATQIDQTPNERRRASRIPRHSDVRVLECRDGVIGRSLTVQLRDVSARGIGLLHPTPVPKGHQFVLPVLRRDGPPNHLLYRVVRCERLVGQGFMIGAELECILRDAALGRPVVAAAAAAAAQA